jgi:hypothetical protein
MTQVTVDNDHNCYVIHDTNTQSVSALSFSICWDRLFGIAAWLGEHSLYHGLVFGTLDVYNSYIEVCRLGEARYAAIGHPCPILLTPSLVGYEGQWVRVYEQHGRRRKFIVGRSTGWLPVHLEIKDRRAYSGHPVTGTPFRSVRVLPCRSHSRR